jgi:hypothetical protein
VQITQIAEIADNPPEPPTEVREKFDDDPVNKQEKILYKYLDRVEKMNARPVLPGLAYANEFTDGASMTRNIKISADTFEDISEVLKKFSDAAKTLPEVPDSLLTSVPPQIMPMMG